MPTPDLLDAKGRLLSRAATTMVVRTRSLEEVECTTLISIRPVSCPAVLSIEHCPPQLCGPELWTAGGLA